MNDGEQIVAFANELASLVDRYAQEFELSTPAAVGVLHMQIRLLEDDILRRYRAQQDLEEEEPE